jgi:O-antigen/teichoic acid export membrane protein
MRLNIKYLLQDKFVLGTFFLTAASFGGSFLNYLVHPILTRHLSVAAYGDFQALLSLVMILGVLAAVINTTLTKEMSVLAAERPEEIDALRRRAAARFFWFGLAAFVLIIIFARPLNDLFKISESAILIIASLNFLYVFPLIVNRAVLSGRQDFFALAFSNFLDAFSRLLFIIFLVVIWPFGLTGAAWALGLTGLAAFLVSLYQVKKLNLPLAPDDFRPSLRRFWRYSLLVLWFMALTQFFYNFDMLLVKSFFSPEEAGLYGALLTIGRIIYFVGGAVPIVMFPVIANLKGDKSLRRYAVLGKSLLLMAALTLPAYLIISLWPGFIIRIIVGAKYLTVAPYLPGFASFMLAFTLVTALSNYFLALSSRRSLLILTIAALGEVILLSLFHNDLSQIIFSLGLIFGAAALGLLSLVFFEYNRAKCRLLAELTIV